MWAVPAQITLLKLFGEVRDFDLEPLGEKDMVSGVALRRPPRRRYKLGIPLRGVEMRGALLNLGDDDDGT